MVCAYIDPGSGSLLLQVMLATCLGGLAVFWQKIKSLFAGRQPGKPKRPEDGPTPE